MNQEENGRLLHDCAMATAAHILECFDVESDEFREKHTAVYVRIQACLIAYLDARHRELRRLGKMIVPKNPSEN